MRFLNMESLSDKIQQSKGSIYNKLNPKSKYYDPSFPKPRRLGKRCVRWVEAEIDTWMDNPGGMPTPDASCVPA